jgi:outer membrane beta-barrel protein
VEQAPAPPAAAPLGIVHKVRLTGSARNVVRTGPGDDYAIAGVYAKGRVFDVIAKSGSWINVRLTPTETGWIHSSLCKEFDDLSGLEFRPNPKLYNRTGSFTLTGYTGAYAFDRKSNSLVLGGRFGYYVFDRVIAEGGLSWTHIKRNPEIVESLFALSLEAENFHMLFYHLLLTYEVLPGRQMVPFVSAGVGSSIHQGETDASFNYGAGTTLFVSKRSAVRWEVRNYRMDTGAKGARVTNNNVEFSLGTEFLF